MRVTKDERKRGRAWVVFHVPVALSRSSRGEASHRTRLYIKWRSRFTSQIESRAIGRFSISFNNRLCYTSPFSALSACFSPLLLLLLLLRLLHPVSPAVVPSFGTFSCFLLREAYPPRFDTSRIAEASFLHFEILKSDHRPSALPFSREREKICEFRYVSIFYIISAAEAIAKPSCYRLKLSCNCS